MKNLNTTKLLAIGTLLILATTITIPQIFSHNPNLKINGEHKFKADVQVKGEDESPEVKVKVKGGPPGTYDVMLKEGNTTAKLGTLVVKESGRGSGTFPIDIAPGEHNVSIIIKNSETTLLTTRNFQVTVQEKDEEEDEEEDDD